MSKVTRKLVLLMSLSVYPMQGMSEDGGGLPASWQNETARIRGVVEANPRSVYFIRIFEGLIPLPNRYVQTITSGPVLEFNSRLEVALVPEPAGHIRAGMYQDYLDIYADQFVKRRATEISSNGIALNVTLFSPSDGIPVLAGINTVLVHDSKQFLLISDQNPDLWKVMLEVYEQLSK